MVCVTGESKWSERMKHGNNVCGMCVDSCFGIVTVQ